MINQAATDFVRRKWNQNARRYDGMETVIKNEWRGLVTSQARGRVLEIGVGTGKTLPYYDPQITSELVGIDLCVDMLRLARSKPCAVPTTFLLMDAQQLAFPDASFDTVATACVFCSVPDPVLGLQEARRVCKPGGRIVLLEHVRIDRPVIGTLMDLMDPIVHRIMGSHINRRTVENARLAGLTVERVESVRGDLVKLICCRP